MLAAIKLRNSPLVEAVDRVKVGYGGAEIGPIVMIPSHVPVPTRDQLPSGNDVRVRVNFQGDGAGWVNMGRTCSSVEEVFCETLLPIGSTISLAAWHDQDSTFGGNQWGWGGDCNPSNGSISIDEALSSSVFSSRVLDRSITCTMTFTQTHMRFPIEVNVAGEGIGAVFSGTIQDIIGISCGSQGTGRCTEIFREGWDVRLSAIPASESVF
jgi:hypothetical protein